LLLCHHRELIVVDFSGAILLEPLAFSEKLLQLGDYLTQLARLPDVLLSDLRYLLLLPRQKLLELLDFPL